MLPSASATANDVVPVEMRGGGATGASSGS